MNSLLQKFKEGLFALPYDVRDLCLEAWQSVVHKKWLIIPFLAAILVAAWFILPHDAEWLSKVRGSESAPAHKVAEELSYWGDFPTGILLAFGVGWTLAVLFGNKTLRRISVCFILAAAVAGLIVNSFRTTLGRPRPSAGVPDKLYGLRSGSEYHAFPSGHSATSFATAGTFLAIYPPAGVPLFFVASGVGWSRMELNRHHPTDILVGGAVGLVVGLSFGAGLRRLKSN